MAAATAVDTIVCGARRPKTARTTVAAATVLLACLLPGVAFADPSGSITNVHPSGDGYSVYATYTTTYDQCVQTTYVFCGWFPHAWQIPASESCVDDESHLTYVGQFQNASGTQTGTDLFYPAYNPARICLYVSGPDFGEHFIADYVYPAAAVAPALTPVPTTPPAPSSPAPQHENLVPMTIAEARGLVASTLRAEYHSRFSRSTLARSCGRLSRLKVRCHVAWRKSAYKYSGTLTSWYDQSDADGDYSTYSYSTSIKRRRIHKPTRRPHAEPSCDPNYAGACLKPNVSDYDCAGGSGDGPYYTGPVRVVGVDHYGLDRDGDGVACET